MRIVRLVVDLPARWWHMSRARGGNAAIAIGESACVTRQTPLVHDLLPSVLEDRFLPENTMHSKARLFGHSIHQMLIVFPLGLLATSLLFDIVYEATGNGRWADISYVMIAAGVVGGLIAAVFGLIDWIGIPDQTRAKRIGALHGIGNVVVVALFGISWLLRNGNPIAPSAVAVALSVAGVLLALVTGWLGGELVDRLAVGVDEGAHLNAPSSLSGRPASDIATRVATRVGHTART